MVTIISALYAPGITADNAVQSLNGIDDGGSSLTKETREATVAVIKDGQTQAVGHLTDGNTATGCGNNVVDGRWLRLTQEFPHCRTQQREGCRLPERQAIGTGCIEVQVSMIRVGKHVGDKEVVVPHHAVGKVMLQRV